MFSSTSATRTNKVMMRAVKNSPIAVAAMMAMLMDCSMVIRREAMFSAASLKIGQPPNRTPAKPMRLIRGNGSQKRSHRAIVHSTTRPIRTPSSQLMECPSLASSAASSAASPCSCLSEMLLSMRW